MICRCFLSARSINSFGLCRGRSEWLLDENVFAILERGLGELEMRPDRRDHRHRIDHPARL